uniref:Uncharacterized protein n=1 Tax=Chromera velia CCMP2878 TaxID=1169474 RepID=A0A0G4FVJ2_9ALVE|eukprot:Cvel_19001.t1-p1 / transcript=Cvel_19001.t1 / gene=Cvel_19001 / organism=Chromera_velia_CCMP2878 / gene_product=hypothetical protein / transcript_product=hypothetical protein / location=Cvel_scaffold1608:18494-21095(-) / protein_length=498 / sequence_SO=supercontig / SO=protein_coding / is_pseudo=false
MSEYLNGRVSRGGGGLLVRVADDIYFRHDSSMGDTCTPVSFLSWETEVPYAVWHAPWYFEDAMSNGTSNIIRSDAHCPSSVLRRCPSEAVGLDPPPGSPGIGWDFPVVTTIIAKRFEEQDRRVMPSALYPHDANSCNDAYAPREGRLIPSFWGRNSETGRGCRMGVFANGTFDWAGDLCCAPEEGLQKGKGKGSKEEGKKSVEIPVEGQRCLTRLEHQCECEWAFAGSEGDWVPWVQHYAKFRGSNEVANSWKRGWQKYLNLAACWFPPTPRGFEGLTCLQNALYHLRDLFDDDSAPSGKNQFGVKRWWGWTELAAPRGVSDRSVWDAVAIKLPPGAVSLESLSADAIQKLSIILRSFFLTVLGGSRVRLGQEQVKEDGGDAIASGRVSSEGLLESVGWGRKPVLLLSEVPDREGRFRRRFFCEDFDLGWVVLRFHSGENACVLCEKGSPGFTACMETASDTQREALARAEPDPQRNKGLRPVSEQALTEETEALLLV